MDLAARLEGAAIRHPAARSVRRGRLVPVWPELVPRSGTRRVLRRSWPAGSGRLVAGAGMDIGAAGPGGPRHTRGR